MLDSTARVMALVKLLEPFPGDVRINLGRRKVAVSEQHLNDAQIRPVIQQVRRERMT
jgi:hypothetical protein